MECSLLIDAGRPGAGDGVHEQAGGEGGGNGG